MKKKMTPGGCLPLPRGYIHVHNHYFQTSSPLKPIKPKFYVEPPWEGGIKVYINSLGHMSKMAAMPIYGKTLKNLLLQNQKSYDLEAWHVSLGSQVLQSLYK